MMGILRPFSRIFLAAFLLTLAANATQASALSRRAITAATDAEQLLLRQANSARVQRSLPELTFDLRLAKAARFHAEQMASHADISHGFPGEPDLSMRGASAGVHFSLITENVAEAGDPGVIHGLWMNSPGHRANLLDPDVNVVGIAVIERGDAVFAVEDFATTVEQLSLDQQEATVAQLLATSGLNVPPSGSNALVNARQTCSMATGYAGVRQPWYIMRYTASKLDVIPEQLRAKLTSGQYHEARVGACETQNATAFSSYNIAILLYP